ncbi:MAG TPA: Uma2 family endonuclease [Thermoanaerobaculia bacterium]|nr:Uma2 family endonuclease [Thermoanaerobaculia bacterium]
MALPETRTDRRTTREAYERMVKEGAFVGRSVELVRGIVHEMSPQDSLHAAGLRRARRVLEAICPEGYEVDVQMPLNLGLDSEPEPDLAIVRRDPLEYVQGHPTSALLVVEIADSSLRHDRDKAGMYALAGIEDFWIANLVRGVLEVYREPVDGTYRTRQVLRRGERIAPLARPDAMLPVDDLLLQKPPTAL